MRIQKLKQQIQMYESELAKLDKNDQKYFDYSFGLMMNKIQMEKMQNFPILYEKFDNIEFLSGFITGNHRHFIYKDSVLSTNEPSPHHSIKYLDKKNNSEVLSDFLAYLTNNPTLIQNSENKETVEYLEEIFSLINYSQFGKTNRTCVLKDKYDVITIHEINHPILFSLYNTALKQPEPFGKCIFLFRIIEYSFENIDIGIQKNDKPKYPSYVNKLIQSSLKHTFFPFWTTDDYRWKTKEYTPYFDLLKSKVNQIIETYINNNMDCGHEIYKYARCGLAHGGNPDNTILHDYTDNYYRISNVNIILELACSFIIESVNNQLKDLFLSQKPDNEDYLRL